MKKLKVFLLWTAIALIIQNSIFFYFDKVYLAKDTSVKPEKVEKKKVSNMKEIAIPAEAKNIKMSHDGVYISFLEGGILRVGDRTKGTVKSVEAEKGMTINYVKWVTDGDFLIIAEKTQNTKGNQYISIHKYDALRNEKVQLTDLDLKKDIINLSSSKANIKDMVFATSSNVMYFEVAKTSSISDIYKINVMSQLEKYSMNLQLPNAIDIDPINANFLYEQSNVIKLATRINQRSAKKLADGLILGHSDNFTFIGKGKSNIVEEISYGDVASPITSWETIKLDSKINKKDIFITPGGKVFINNSNGVLIDALDKKNFKYEGELQDINDRGFLCNVNGESKVTDFE